MVLVACWTVLVANPASAASTKPPVKEAVTGWNDNSIWAGNYRLDSGQFPVYCIKAYAWYPVGSYSKAVAVPQTETAARIGWVIGSYGSSKSPDVEAAVAALIGLHYDVVNTSEKWNAVTTAQRSLALGYWAASAKYAGPYRVAVSLPTGVQRGSSATGSVSVLSASGVPVPGFALSLSGQGANLTNKALTTGPSGTARFAYSLPTTDSAGSYSISASGRLVTGVVEYDPTGTGPVRQIVMGAADPTVQSATSSIGYATTRPTTLIKYQSGDAQQLPVAGASYSLEDSNGTVLSTVTTSSTPVSLGQLTEGASYQLIETAAPAGYYIPSSNDYSFTVAIGASPQLVTLSDPLRPSPVLTTSLAASSLPVGGSTSDALTLTGNDGEASSLSYQLLGPVTPAVGHDCSSISSQQWAAAPVAQSGTLALSPVSASVSTGSASTPVLKTPGCYSYSDQASLSPSSATASSPAGSVDEVLEVSAPSVPTTNPGPAPLVPAGGAPNHGPSSHLGLLLGGLALLGLGTAGPLRIRHSSKGSRS